MSKRELIFLLTINIIVEFCGAKSEVYPPSYDLDSQDYDSYDTTHDDTSDYDLDSQDYDSYDTTHDDTSDYDLDSQDYDSYDTTHDDTSDSLCNIELVYNFDDGTLQGWRFHGRHGYYAENLNGTVHIYGDSFSSPYSEAGGIEKTIDIYPGSLYISFLGRAKSDFSESTVTNLHLVIKNEDESQTLYEECIVCGGTYDTNWFTYTNDLSQYVIGYSRVKIILCLGDHWIANWNQENFYDNITIRSSCN